MSHGASPTYTEAQMLAALKRVYAACGSCSQDDYAALRASTEPSERTIRCRFGTFNKGVARLIDDVPAELKPHLQEIHEAAKLRRGLPRRRSSPRGWGCRTRQARLPTFPSSASIFLSKGTRTVPSGPRAILPTTVSRRRIWKTLSPSTMTSIARGRVL